VIKFGKSLRKNDAGVSMLDTAFAATVIGVVASFATPTIVEEHRKAQDIQTVISLKSLAIAVKGQYADTLTFDVSPEAIVADEPSLSGHISTSPADVAVFDVIGYRGDSEHFEAVVKSASGRCFLARETPDTGVQILWRPSSPTETCQYPTFDPTSEGWTDFLAQFTKGN
jgi:hypothetical protein